MTIAACAARKLTEDVRTIAKAKVGHRPLEGGPFRWGLRSHRMDIVHAIQASTTVVAVATSTHAADDAARGEQ
jgi:hypothetical protein